jgi:amino acid adenylation domain-containing protein
MSSISGVQSPEDLEISTLRDLMGERARHDGQRLAYAFLDDSLAVSIQLTYAQLADQSRAIASQLALRVTPGDRVLLAFDNGFEAVSLFWGCVAAGVIPVPAPAPKPLRAKSRNTRLTGIAADAGCRLVMASDEHVKAAKDPSDGLEWLSMAQLLDGHVATTEAPPAPASAIAYLQYTSGSTSEPRGVEITHANALAQCKAISEVESFHPDHTRVLLWLPWFHDYGLVNGLILPVYSCAPSYLMPTRAFTLNPLKWLEAIDKYRITLSGGPDFSYAACVAALAKQKQWSAQLDCWTLATNGAEPVRASTLTAFGNAFAPHGFHADILAPSYGLAEAVLCVTLRNLRSQPRCLHLDAKALEQKRVVPAEAPSKGSRTLVSCGPPLPGLEVRIVDPATRTPCEPHQVGEIWISGPSVGQGYWNRPDISESLFRAHLRTGDSESEQTYLRTGDLGFVSEGELFVAGRHKDMIVVNGRNIYPHDLEHTAQTAHAGIRAGGVMAVSVDKGSKESAVVLQEMHRRPSPETVREAIDAVRKNIAAEFELDVLEVVPLPIGTLPRTSSGKPQRSAARHLYLQGALEPMRLQAQAPNSRGADGALEPDAGLLDAISTLWADVLDVQAVEPEANFFDLGGDSLLATQMVSRLRARLGVELPISALFEAPTVPGLARLVMQSQAQRAPAQDPDASDASTRHAIPETPDTPERRSPGQAVTLSYSQERMWFMHELAPESSAYNIPLAMRLQGEVDQAAMQRALEQVVARHEILRTQFVKTAEGVRGEVIEAHAPVLERVSLRLNGEPATEGALRSHLVGVTTRPFQLDQLPLYRAQLIELGDREAVLLIVMHHIISDQWSFAEMGREMAAQYSAHCTGHPLSLPPLTVQYADYAAWHRAWFESRRREQELAYWTRRLEGLEPLPLNEDFVRPLQQSFRGAAHRMPLASDEIAGLRRLGAQQGASLSMVLIAALNVLLHRHTGKTDIAIGVPIANRHHLSSENLIGTFVNTLVFRTDLDGAPDFQTVLNRVREVSLDAFAHQDMPFEVLVREMVTRPDTSRQPLFNVMFNMVNSQARDCHFEGLNWSRLDFDRASTQFDLTVVADLLYDQAIVIEYATDLFSEETVQRMGEHLRRILRAATSDPKSPIGTMALLGDAEASLLHTWTLGPRNAYAASAPETTVSQWVARGTALAPHATALVFGETRLTHQALDRATNRLANHLRQKGVARGARVGVCLPRSHELVIALLAVMKTGAAYIPLDPGYPSQRLNYQIEDAGLALLITHTSIAESLAGEQPPRLLIDTASESIQRLPDKPLTPDPTLDAGPDDPAYLIYTSGSTGQPKGVAVPHRAAVNFLSSMAREPGFTAQDRMLAVTTPSFDIAVLELFLPLGTGGSVIVASDNQANDGGLLAQLLLDEDITVLQATPSRWHLLLDTGWTGKPNLKALVGGEPLTSSLAAILSERCGAVWNMYGPTETTVWSSCWRVPAGSTQAISLGGPIANTSIQVLDSHLNPCPIGVPGEIYIGGTGVALGYHQRDELTAERFIEQPHADEPENRRIYRTGDRGRWRHDGSLEHGGRLDDQVKLRGYRIELGEIETRLISHPCVARAVVLLREDAPGLQRLVAYVVPHGAMPARDALRQHLRQWLPDHMVPAILVEMEAIPTLPNGKINRKALPVPESKHAGTGAVQIAPRNATERAIWTVWRDQLHLDRLSIHDNFFDLGGHSLLALGVVARIEAALERPCAVSLLFANPTVADLAAALMQAQPDNFVDTPMATLQPHGEGPGLFLLAGAEMYRHLARRLDSQMPVYGVFSEAEIEILQHPPDATVSLISVETLAQSYIDLIRSVQAHGPYYLGGFSIGGVLAYEVAQRLRRSGEEIGLIVLLDTMLPGRGFKHFMAGVLRRLRLIRREGIKHFAHVFRVYRKQTAQRYEPGSRRNQAYAQIIRAYDPAPCDMPALFLQAGDDPSTAPAYGWKGLIADLNVERVPGAHMDIMDPPNVDVLASFVRTHLAQARNRHAQGGST